MGSGRASAATLFRRTYLGSRGATPARSLQLFVRRRWPTGARSRRAPGGGRRLWQPEFRAAAEGLVMTSVLCRAVLAAGIILLPLPSGAQQTDVGARPALPVRLAPETRAALERLIDSARTVGLPINPLVDKAAEGVLKGADDRRILAAVQSLVRELGIARSLLGSASNTALLTAAASALHAGVSPPDRRRLLASSIGDADGHLLTTALVTLVDLVAKRVPPPAAVSSLAELVSRRVPESQYLSLRSEVEQDILAGRAPDVAIAARTRAHVRALDE